MDLGNYITEQELDRLVRYFLFRGKVKNAIMCMLMFYSACRVNELLHIKAQDFDFERKVLYLNVTKFNKPRTVPFPSFIEHWIDSYIREYDIKENQYLFHTPYDKNKPLERTAVNKALTKASKELKMKHVWPHLLRKSFGVMFIQKSGYNGLPFVQRILGHKDPSTTLSAYLCFATKDVCDKYREVVEGTIS